MQGRLSPPVDGRIQAFPRDCWHEEFALADDSDLRIMEWTLDHEELHRNPLMTAAGRQEIRRLSGQYGVAVPSLTGDCFMQAPFWKASGERRHELERVVLSVLDACGATGANIVIVPLVDEGSPADGAEEESLVRFLLSRAEDLDRRGLQLAFESDMAPFENGSEPVRMGLRCRRLPRSSGRSRLGPLRAAAQLLAEETASADLAILHDPELTLLNRYVGCRAVWDVHEDLHAQVADKDWIPGSLRGPVRLAARLLERRAGRRFDLMLAEPGYQSRFDGGTIVRNTPVVPETVVESVDPRVVYVGRVSLGRGLETMLRAMELVDPIHTLHLYGPVDPAAARLLRGRSPSIVTHGFVEGPVALRSIEGAMVGLSLLRDLPNYRHSLPTKILEYLAHGIPVITTPLPEARRIVEESGGGIVVPFDDPDAVAEAIVRMARGSFRRECAENGRRAIRHGFDWAEDASRMVSFLERLAAGGDR